MPNSIGVVPMFAFYVCLNHTEYVNMGVVPMFANMGVVPMFAFYVCLNHTEYVNMGVVPILFGILLDFEYVI